MKTMKRASRRREGQDAVRDAAILQPTINRLRGGALIPRGVYRFRTHEEADEWIGREPCRPGGWRARGAARLLSQLEVSL